MAFIPARLRVAEAPEQCSDFERRSAAGSAVRLLRCVFRVLDILGQVALLADAVSPPTPSPALPAAVSPLEVTATGTAEATGAALTGQVVLQEFVADLPEDRRR